jgi:phosphoribosylformimino-5-aminoimidazole carboxamide ribotide isomerase
LLVIPSLDLEAGRSRVVHWPGAAAGIGTPTDRPDEIVARFVASGATVVHLVDFDGARAGAPRNLEAVARVAARVAIPIQVAGGLEDPDAIRLVFAAGATRVVVSLALADDRDRLDGCLAVAGDWLAVGLDPRPERLASFAWRRAAPLTIEALVGELVGAGVVRFVLAHGGERPDLDLLGHLVSSFDAEFLVAGGAPDVATVARLRDIGVAGVIVGEPLLTGALDLPTLLETAA